ncbi:MAG TPA: hypothetical protein VF883_24400 [Thermoanaerobaculia bacterium]
MRIRPALLILAAALFLGWTPFPTGVTPETWLDEPPPRPGSSSSARLATDGERLFLVSANYQFDGGYDGYAFLLDRDAKPALPQTMLVSRAKQPPQAAASGRGFLYGSSNAQGDATVVRFSKDGARLDATPRPVGPGVIVDMDWDGNEYVILRDYGFGIAATRVNEDAQPLSSTTVIGGAIASHHGVSVIVSGASPAPAAAVRAQTFIAGVAGTPFTIGNGTSASVAASESGFLVTWTSGGEIRGRLLEPSGKPDGSSFFVAVSQGRAVAAWNGQSWVVVYDDRFEQPRLRGVRVLRGPVGSTFDIATNAADPSVTAIGSTVYVAWLNASSTFIEAATIENDVVTRVGAANRHAGEQSRAGLVAAGGASLAVWVDGHDIRARRMLPGAVTTTPVDQTLVAPMALASRGTEALIVTQDFTDPRLNLLRTDAAGNPLSTTAVIRNTVPSGAAAVWTGTNWLVAWHERRTETETMELFAVRMSADGVLLESPALLASLHGVHVNQLTLAAAGDLTLVLWPDGNERQTHAYLVRDGRALPYHAIVPAGARAASDGTDFLVAGIRRAATGDVLEWQRLSGPKQELPLPMNGLMPHVFWTGENYLVVARSASPLLWFPDRIEFYGVRVAADGTAADTAPVHFATIAVPGAPIVTGLTMRSPNVLDVLYSRRPDDPRFTATRLAFRSLFVRAKQRAVR